MRILCEKLLIISQRFFGIPPFRFYALADGIQRILSNRNLQSASRATRQPPIWNWPLARRAGNSGETPTFMPLTFLAAKYIYTCGDLSH